MRHIVFNGFDFASESNPAGIIRHTYELLKELDKIVPYGKVDILAPNCDFDASVFQNIRFVKIGVFNKDEKKEKTKWVQSLIWRFLIFPSYSILHRAYTINPSLTWRYYNFDAISIYDCTLDLYYQNSKYEHEQAWGNRIIHNQKEKTQTCKFVLTDSESAKRDICRVYHVPEEKIEVIPCGWQHMSATGEDPVIIERLGLTDKEYFFSLGSRMPHKNIIWVAAAARKHPQYIFVVTGSRLSRKETSFEGEIPENMIFTGYLKDEEIKALMHCCKAFIQPSLNEGFGIPPMEAMSVGANCIVSNAGSLPEVYKNSVWYIDPYDYDHIDLDEIMTRPKESNDLILNEYSWEKSAKKLYRVLQKRAK